jgi:hypothetical protein
LAVLDLRESSGVKKSRVMESLKFGLSVFPEYCEFWLAIVDKMIDHESYEEAEQVIRDARESI